MKTAFPRRPSRVDIAAAGATGKAAMITAVHESLPGPKRPFATLNCRIAKGSFDHVANGNFDEHRHGEAERVAIVVEVVSTGPPLAPSSAVRERLGLGIRPF